MKQSSKGHTPKVREPDVSRAFQVLSRLNEGVTIDLETRQYVETEVVEVGKKGKIGWIIDYLVGKRKLPKTVTKYKGGLSSHTLKLIDIIIEEKTKVKADKTQELLNNINT